MSRAASKPAASTKGAKAAKERKDSETIEHGVSVEPEEDQDPYQNQQSTPVFHEKPSVLEEVTNRVAAFRCDRVRILTI